MASVDTAEDFFLPGYDMTDLNMPLEELQWDFLMPDFQADPSTVFSLPALSEAIPNSPFANGFQLQQLDSVEAKCIDIRSYLRTFRSSLPDEAISTYVTRDRLLTSIQWYGKFYQPVMPILHLPTFELVKTPPVLLLAMMLVGDCYCDSKIPAPTTLQFAIHILLLIESSPHERNMQVPSLPSIQALALLCHLLAVTKNPTAYNFASVQRGRLFSMAERAGLFSTAQPVDYTCLTENTFDWFPWVDGEMRRRLAYHIFVTDLGNCIFMRGSSHLSPSAFHVDTPCYESCWLAATSTECLTQLQHLPSPTPMATALRKINSATAHESYLFDASDFGMHAIIIALHRRIFHVMDESLDRENNIPSSSEFSDVVSNLSTLLLNHDVANIADEIVNKYGSEAMKRANSALSAWRRNWDLRRIHDVHDKDNTSAFSHPLNFWVLAKLFLVLHFFRNHTSASTGGKQDSEFLLFSQNAACTIDTKIRLQVQVINWLSKIRRRQHTDLLPAEDFMSQVISAG
jgi:hypothetical protein